MAKEIFTKSYRGTQAIAFKRYREDVSKMAEMEFYPVSQVWAEGSYGCLPFLVALVLCFFVVGIFVFLYLLIVKPAGQLTVTYEKEG